MSNSLPEFAHLALHYPSLTGLGLNFCNSHHVPHRCSSDACLVFAMTSLLSSALHSGLQVTAAYRNFICASNSPVRWIPPGLITISIWPRRNLTQSERLYDLGKVTKLINGRNQDFPSVTVTLTPWGRLWGKKAVLKTRPAVELYLWASSP